VLRLNLGESNDGSGISLSILHIGLALKSEEQHRRSSTAFSVRARISLWS
jgi:hypothetical protein